MRMHLLALAAAAGLAAPAFAQSGQTSQPQNRAAQPGVQAPAATSGQAMSAAQFMTMAMQSDAFEMQSAKLASERAQNQAVKSYAQKMLADHGKTSATLMQMRGETTASAGQASSGQAGHGAMAPLDQKHAGLIRELQGTNGAAFDKKYVQQQVMAHQEAVALFTAYSQNGTDQNLRSFASQTLPALQGHLRDAQALMGQMR